MPPRVFHLVYNLIRGGTEGQCARVAMRFAALGQYHRVGVSRREGFFLGAVERACGPVYEMQIDSLLRWKTWREVRRLASHLVDGQFDLLHAWDADAVIFGCMAARRAGIPVVTSQRDMGEIYAGWKWRLMCHAHRRADRVVVNADAVRERMEAHRVPARRMRMIRNLMDLEEFDVQALRPFSRTRDLPPPPRIVCVARLDPEKDTGTLLSAFAALCRTGREASLVIAGDGVERRSLESQSQALGIAHRTCFLGDTPDIPSLLREMDIGVLTPRRNEGLSNTILEYMAGGLPVVVTDCGGNRELVDHGRTGWVVHAGDAGAISDALNQCLADPVRAVEMGRAGRDFIETHISIDCIADQFGQLYSEVMNLNHVPFSGSVGGG